jgi:hypothetical protein
MSDHRRLAEKIVQKIFFIIVKRSDSESDQIIKSLPEKLYFHIKPRVNLTSNTLLERALFMLHKSSLNMLFYFTSDIKKVNRK